MNNVSVYNIFIFSLVIIIIFTINKCYYSNNILGLTSEELSIGLMWACSNGHIKVIELCFVCFDF